MTNGISGGRSIDLGTAIVPDARLLAPRTVRFVEQDAAVHDGLVRDAFERLGSPGVAPLDPWAELRRTRAIDLATADPDALFQPATQALLGRDAHALRVDLGTEVVLPHRPFDPDTWTVVGIGGSDRVHLRRTVEGATQERTLRWPKLLGANPELAAGWRGRGPIPLELRPVVLPPTVLDDVRAAFELRQASLHPADRAMEAVLAGSGDVALTPAAQGTWRDLSQRFGLARLRPLAALPSDGLTAAELLDNASPIHRAVLASDSEALLGSSMLVGTDAVAATHRASRTASLLDEISSWFAERGLATWRGPEDALLLLGGSPDSIGNASAGSMGRASLVTTGPRDARQLRELTAFLPRDLRTAALDTERVLGRSLRKVLAHEAGHVATQRLWGHDATTLLEEAVQAKDMPAVARLAEHKIAGEAFSDLFGAAFADAQDVGVRQLGRLANGFGNLDQLRASVLRAGLDVDVHVGAQLLTKPMLLVQEAHGSDAMAEVAGSAAKQLGAMLGRGEIASIELPVAAQALRDAAAMRWGAESGLVRELGAAWKTLRVLV